MYNSIVFTGTEDEIIHLSNLLKGHHFDALFPIPENVKGIAQWKRVNWGFSSASDLYSTTHYTNSKENSLMIGFEADGLSLQWVKKVSKKFKNLRIELEDENDETYVYQGGEQENKQGLLLNFRTAKTTQDKGTRSYVKKVHKSYAQESLF